MNANENIRLACITIPKQGSLESLSLLLPHGNVITVELASSIKDISAHGVSSHSLVARNISWPVICVTPDLNITQNLCNKSRSADYRFAACINPTNPRYRFAIMCDQVKSIQCDSKALLQLPTIMHTQQSPIMGTLYSDDTLHCVTDADHLANFLRQHLDILPRQEDSSCELH